MIQKITSYFDIDKRKLMDVYSESNYENTDYFFPDEADKNVAVKKVENGFLDFLKTEFFTRPGNVYWVLEKDGIWISALRTSEIQNSLYYIEALETRPDHRGRGYASQLLTGVIGALQQGGPFRLCDCVGKRNAASLRTHKKCGFAVISDAGYDYLSGSSDDSVYGLEYRYNP